MPGGVVRFVGREVPLAGLRDAAREAASGRGSFVVVRGDAGAGKTRLVTELVEGLDPADRWRVVWCRGVEGPGRGRDLQRRIERAIPAVGGPAGDDVELVDRLLDAADETPVLVVVDDVQWIDPDSVPMLRALGAGCASGRVLVVATERSASGGPVELRLGRRADRTVEVEGLDARAVADLLSDAAGGPVPDGTVAAALAATGGNPLLLVEAVPPLVTAGRLGDAGAWDDVLPSGVAGLVAVRVAALDPPDQRLLRAAAVAAEAEPDGAPPGRLAPLAAIDVGSATARLAAHADLVEVGAGVRFRHDLLRRAILASVPPDEAATLHSALAASLPESAGLAVTAARATHLGAAAPVTGGWEEAAAAGARAAALAAASGAVADAAAWWERTFAWLGPVGATPRAGALLSAADAASRAGRIDLARAWYRAAADTAEQEAEGDEVLARAALGAGSLGGGFEIHLRDHEGLALGERALAALGDRRPHLRARLLARRSVALSFQGRDTERAAAVAEALALAEATGDAAALTEALAAAFDLRSAPADLAWRAAEAPRLLAAGVASGEVGLEALARRHRVVTLLQQGDMVGAHAETSALAALARAHPDAEFGWYAAMLEGMLALLRGQVDRADERCRVAEELGRAAGSHNARLLCDWTLRAAVLRAQGRIDEAGALFRTMLEEHPDATHGFDIGPVVLALDGWPVEEVRRALDALPLAMLEMAVGTSQELLVAWLGGEAEFAIGEAGPWTAHVLATMPPHADQFVVDGEGADCLGPAAHALARASALSGRRDEAAQWYERAETLLAGAGAPLLLRRLRAEQAALSSSGRSSSGRSSPPVPARDEVPALDAPDPLLRREGEVWLVRFGGASARLRDRKGLRDLAVLLAHPGREVHVLDLAGPAGGAPAPITGGGIGPALDATARRAYEDRLRELAGDIAEADAHADLARADRLRDEFELITAELTAALGLGGAPRQVGDPAERARKAVRMRIADALARLEAELPALGRHLRASVRTGLFCSYEPETSPGWTVEP